MNHTREKNVSDKASDGYSEKVHIVGSLIYEARAVAGTGQSEAKWQAWVTDTTGPITKKYADGDNKFDNVASDLTALSYS